MSGFVHHTTSSISNMISEALHIWENRKLILVAIILTVIVPLLLAPCCAKLGPIVLKVKLSIKLKLKLTLKF